MLKLEAYRVGPKKLVSLLYIGVESSVIWLGVEWQSSK